MCVYTNKGQTSIGEVQFTKDKLQKINQGMKGEQKTRVQAGL